MKTKEEKLQEISVLIHEYIVYECESEFRKLTEDLFEHYETLPWKVRDGILELGFKEIYTQEKNRLIQQLQKE